MQCQRGTVSHRTRSWIFVSSSDVTLGCDNTFVQGARGWLFELSRMMDRCLLGSDCSFYQKKSWTEDAARQRPFVGHPDANRLLSPSKEEKLHTSRLRMCSQWSYAEHGEGGCEG